MSEKDEIKVPDEPEFVINENYEFRFRKTKRPENTTNKN